MAGVELATAYISLVPSASGIKDAIAKEFGDVESVAKRQGAKAGDAFGAGFGDKVKDHAGKAGLAASAALTAGFVKDLSIDKGTDKLAAQLGLTADESARAGKLAADVYKGAYGDSLDQVNSAVAAVSKNVSALGTTGTADVERLTKKTLDLATAFDQDVGGVTAAVGQLVKTGLAANADEAFDIITRGFQTGADKAGDLLEVFGEYGTQFRKLGLDGATATGLLTQGLQAGARDADIVADAFKEFSIRAIDGSKLTGEGFTAVGLDAKTMALEIAKGGPAASAALDLTLDRLRAVKDPVAQAAAATALFGTQAEDLGAALFSLDPSAAVAGLGQVGGAADAMGTTLSDNTGTKIDSFKRRFELMTAGVGDAVGPLGAALPALGGLTTTLGGLGPVGGKVKDLAVGLGSAAKSAAMFATAQAAGLATTLRTNASLAAQTVALVAQTVATKVAAVAQGIFNAIMALNPIFLIVLAVVAFIAILVLAYTKVEWFRNFVDAAFRLVLGVITSVVDWVRNNWPLLLAIITGPIGLAVLFITSHFDKIKGAFTAVKDFIVDVARGIFDPLIDAFKAVVGAIISAWNAIDFGIHIKIPSWVPGLGGKGFDVDDIFPDIPNFGGGGIVPGSVGSPQLILAHGGEEVSMPGRGSGGGGPMIGSVQVDARGMQHPQEVAEYVGRHVAWRSATAGVRPT